MSYCIKILLLLFCTCFFACDKVKRKGNDLIDKASNKIDNAKQKISDRKDSLIERVFLRHDSAVADTERDKERFREHLQIEVSQDVREVYTHTDYLGIDYKVLIAFKCERSTIKKIAERKKMKQHPVSENHAMRFSGYLNWWDQEKIDSLQPYKVGTEGSYWEYLWYDPISKQAFYEEYSL